MTALSKKRLRAAACAAAVAAAMAVLLVALSALFLPKGGQQAYGTTSVEGAGVLGEPGETVDVLFIGDSETYSAFSPLQMWADHGFTSYVCATSGQRLPYGNMLLHRATEAQKPKVVVIETNTIYAPFSAEEAAMRAAQDALPVIEFHNRWKEAFPGPKNLKAAEAWSTEFKGYYLNKDVKPGDASRHMEKSDKVEEIPALNRQYLQSMVDYCKQIGAKPILVSTPSTVNWNAARHNGIQQFAKETGVEYIDLNTGQSKIDIDWNADTRDGGDHLNHSGATKVSAWIGKHLAETYKLPDHRSDKNYSSWHDALALYQERIKE